MADNNVIPSGTERIETRPYPNEHAARIKDPKLFMKGDENWGSKDIADGIRIILGRLKSTGKWENQTYRFKADKFTVAEAKKWLKDHDVKYILFEPAKDSKSENPDANDDRKEEPENLERRSMLITDAEMRLTDGDKPRLVGYAAKYGIKANLGYFIEKIKAGAFDEVLKTSDSRALKNHDPNLLLGRESSGTLRLESNSVGLHFEIDVPNTTTGKDTAEEIRRGDLNGCSFAFIVEEEEWKHSKEQPSERTIIKIGKLFDVGPVTYPAYEDTNVAVRSLEKSLEISKENRAKKYECECIECGYVKESDKHCKDIKCPECGGKMRRKERPGPGRSDEDKKSDHQRQLEIEKGYRKAGRIINRNKSANV